VRILLTGGAGYIGSHAAVDLLAAGHEIEIVDSLINSSPVVIDRIADLAGSTPPLHVFDLRDAASLDSVFDGGQFDAVIHFAGLKSVAESVAHPELYFDVNVGSSESLLAGMERHGVRTLVFSSSATVYGANAPVPYQETFEPLAASNPYGQSKLAIERRLAEVARGPGWRIAALRYFNPVGAHPSGHIGEDPRGVPNNLMPYVSQVAAGRRDVLTVFGNDYDTADGTCERDFIHVIDLVAGHRAALDALQRGDEGHWVWNLGTGRPASVLQLLAAFERAVGRPIPHTFVERRAGDLPSYFADATRAREDLGWTATHTLDEMCADAWRWQSANPAGYQ
jgi:UDP-glucose 4-epimerase